MRLTASDTTKTFPNVTFSATMAYKAGLYLADVAGASVTLVASARDGAGNCIGIGQANVAGPSAGDVAGPVSLTMSHTSVCTSAGTGTGGNNGVGTGEGGGSGGSSSGSGGSGSGGTNGGTGGTNGGTGGQSTANLITNGDFSNGEDSWAIKAGTGTVTTASGAYCVAVPSNNVSVTIGYPAGTTPSFQINGGVSYRLSYQASASSSSVTFEAKVGQTQPPYDAVGSDWPGEAVGPSLQTFSHTFTRGSTDSMMGVAFNIAGGPATVCIDNVSLTPN